jgi:hypothetical protein
MAASTSSGFHTYSSWGRTRRPKNITGSDGTAVVDCADLAAAAAGTGVYITQNQRYLHLSAAADGSVSHIWAYSYASNAWAELLIGGAIVTLASSKYKIIEIDGIDKVALDIDGSVFAACTTF